jgi:hypothetical protein
MLRATLVAEGRTDQRLIPILAWIAMQEDVDLQVERADFFGLRHHPATLTERIRQAMILFPCDILFVHRDSDGQPVPDRVNEIVTAVTAAAVAVKYVPVIPVRMQETWLLFNEDAIRLAAGYPKGRERLNLPAIPRLESLATPKETLEIALKVASGLAGRKLKKFDANKAAYRLAELIGDFSPLRALPAFVDLETRLKAALV